MAPGVKKSIQGSLTPRFTRNQRPAVRWPFCVPDRRGAERRLGELIRALKETVGLNRGANGSCVSGSEREPLRDDRPTLAKPE